jgi:hypothetical protein
MSSRRLSHASMTDRSWFLRGHCVSSGCKWVTGLTMFPLPGSADLYLTSPLLFHHVGAAHVPSRLIRRGRPRTAPPYQPGPPAYRPALSAAAARVPSRLIRRGRPRTALPYMPGPPTYRPALSPRVIRVPCDYCHCLYTIVFVAYLASVAVTVRPPCSQRRPAGLLCRRPFMLPACYAAGLLCRRPAMPSPRPLPVPSAWGGGWGPVGDDTQT